MLQRFKEVLTGYAKIKNESDFRRALIHRDHGCVFCYLGYRPEDHVPIADYDYHLYHGKAFSCCAYHAIFLNPINPVYLARRKEMHDILDQYLADKEDPQVI